MIQIRIISFVFVYLIWEQLYTLYVYASGGEDIWWYLSWQDWATIPACLIYFSLCLLGIWLEWFWVKYLNILFTLVVFYLINGIIFGFYFEGMYSEQENHKIMYIFLPFYILFTLWVCLIASRFKKVPKG